MPNGERRAQTLTKKNIDAIAKAMERGVPITRACALFGVSKASLYHWRNEVEALSDDDNCARAKLLRYFDQRTELAQSKRIDKLLRNIDEKGANDWRADAWLLERSYPKDFQEHQAVDANVTNAPMLDALTKAANMVTDQDGDT